ncbi:general stress protein CsbD [Erythrobacter sp. CCH5-A1]|jgi:uncharacterized protein YjbJ (UPF0337 family)|uniref:general stress protein CsbD n=1 Tax=Erythrobacter sp. CCH5-A1 TaxID=1768792 RepID=UPI00082BAD2A|nr:general stress protein CsbD [Erythrobacter sp. CCH5-A1]
MGEFTDKAKGAAKEVAGKVKQQSSDPATRADGRAQEVDGKLDKAKGSVKGALGDRI